MGTVSATPSTTAKGPAKAAAPRRVPMNCAAIGPAKRAARPAPSEASMAPATYSYSSMAAAPPVASARRTGDRPLASLKRSIRLIFSRNSARWASSILSQALLARNSMSFSSFCTISCSSLPSFTPTRSHTSDRISSYSTPVPRNRLTTESPPYSCSSPATTCQLLTHFCGSSRCLVKPSSVRMLLVRRSSPSVS